jgi:hypothetical protein
MLVFFSGMTTMGFLIAGFFFLKFWRRTSDILFLAFAGAFWLFAVNQALITYLDSALEDLSWIYLFRLVGFALLIAAIAWKNVANRSPRLR